MGLITWRDATTTAGVAAARAAAGAAYLDEKLGPVWEARIDPERLDIGSPVRCILGQLGWTGVWLQFTFDDASQAAARGFSSGALADWAWLFCRPRALAQSYALLTEAWRELLAARRAAQEAAPRRDCGLARRAA